MLDAFLLADGRFPAGGHVHSAGVEAAVADGRVHDEESLAAYMHGRLHTAGLTDAALAVGDHDADPRRRRAGRARGRAARARRRGRARASRPAAARGVAPARAPARARGGACWPSVVLPEAAGLLPDGPHQPCALGLVGCAAGLAADEVARARGPPRVATPGAGGACGLLGLDPFAVAALAAGLAADGEAVVREALSLRRRARWPTCPRAPGRSSRSRPWSTRQWDVRMFTT